MNRDRMSSECRRQLEMGRPNHSRCSGHFTLVIEMVTDTLATMTEVDCECPCHPRP